MNKLRDEMAEKYGSFDIKLAFKAGWDECAKVMSVGAATIESNFKLIQADREQLQAKVTRLESALKFYADHPMKNTHIEMEINGGEWIPFGTVAREALEDGGKVAERDEAGK